MAALTAVLTACNVPPAPRAVTVETLRTAPAAPLGPAERVVVSDVEELRRLCSPLGPRLGLLQVRTPAQWQRLARLVPQLGACPDLARGMVIGLACWAGEPVNGAWPIRIEAVRVSNGAGLVEGHFAGGSYQPDGSARLETVFVPTAVNVLIVDVDGTTFYPQ